MEEFDHHLPKSFRILKSSEFKFDGEKLHKQPFKVVGRANKLTHSRVGLVVTKKFSKSAVVRNKVKRTVREFFRKSPMKLLGIDFVFILSRSQYVRDWKNLADELNKSLVKIEGSSLWDQIKKER